MPPSAGSARETWQIVAYVRGLSVGKGANSARGDLARGAALFQKSGCVNCHSVDGVGGTLGPDLSQIGSERSFSHLQHSVTDPDSEVLPDHWTFRGRTTSGQQISGVRLNEDTFSIQYRDKEGRLKSVFKRDLIEHEIVRRSPMPSYKTKLAGSEMNDLIAYLASRRGVNRQ
jgi:putative heme-binding domain-containing protein